jgi:predicted nucleotidyltransferase component of viral defense system
MAETKSTRYHETLYRALESFGNRAESVKWMVGKELLHPIILEALLDLPDLPEMQFQGGTCLRLFYGNPRLSEDLDFAVANFSEVHLGNFAQRLEKALSRGYGLSSRVKIPNPLTKKSAPRHVAVKSWQIVVETDLDRNEPSQHIKIDFAEIPSFSREILPLVAPWQDFQATARILVPTQSIEEIAADKTLALAVQQKFLRVRDIFDLAFCRQKGAKPRKDWVYAKAAQYGDNITPDLWQNTIDRVSAYIRRGLFAKEMSRFLIPDTHDNLMSDAAFLAYCDESVRHFMQAMQNDINLTSEPRFFQ